jgi:hypothetical protein
MGGLPLGLHPTEWTPHLAIFPTGAILPGLTLERRDGLLLQLARLALAARHGGSPGDSTGSSAVLYRNSTATGLRQCGQAASTAVKATSVSSACAAIPGGG